MRRVLWWLIGGARGGRNRLRIVRTLDEQPMNTHQLSQALDLDYKTVQHHLELLTENGVLMTMGDGYGKTYFLTDAMEQHRDVLDEVARQADLDDVEAATGDSGDATGDGGDEGGGPAGSADGTETDDAEEVTDGG